MTNLLATIVAELLVKHLSGQHDQLRHGKHLDKPIESNTNMLAAMYEGSDSYFDDDDISRKVTINNASAELKDLLTIPSFGIILGKATKWMDALIGDRRHRADVTDDVLDARYVVTDRRGNPADPKLAPDVRELRVVIDGDSNSFWQTAPFKYDVDPITLASPARALGGALVSLDDEFGSCNLSEVGYPEVFASVVLGARTVEDILRRDAEVHDLRTYARNAHQDGCVLPIAKLSLWLNELNSNPSGALPYTVWSALKRQTIPPTEENLTILSYIQGKANYDERTAEWLARKWNTQGLQAYHHGVDRQGNHVQWRYLDRLDELVPGCLRTVNDDPDTVMGRAAEIAHQQEIVNEQQQAEMAAERREIAKVATEMKDNMDTPFSSEAPADTPGVSRLRTVNEIIQEGEAQSHCLAWNKALHVKAYTGKCAYYAVTGPNGARSSLELTETGSNWKVTQHFGYHNSDPDPVNVKLIKDWLGRK